MKRNFKNHGSNACPLTTDGTMQVSILRALIASSSFNSLFSLAVLRPRYAMHAGKGRKDQKGGHNCWCAALVGAARENAIRKLSYCLPVLLDVERPFELQVLVLVVVGEHGGGLIVATADHTGGRGLGLDWGETDVRLLAVCALRKLWVVTYTSSRIRACRWCWASKSPGTDVSKSRK